MLIPIAAAQHRAVSARRSAIRCAKARWRWAPANGKTIATVVVPAATQGIITGMMLGVARVAGETAPLLFTALQQSVLEPGLEQPTASLPVMIYTYAISPYDDWHQQAWAAGLVLLVLVLIANIAARMVLSRGIAVQRG